MNQWIEELKRFVSNETALILVGSKCDLDAKRVISFETGKKLADSFGIMFIEVSSKDNINIDKMFNKLTQAVININNFQPVKSINLGKPIKQKNTPCCQI